MPNLGFVALDVFSDMKDGLAQTLGSTSDVAGFFIGLIVVIVIAVAVALMLGQKHPEIVFLTASGGIIFVIAVGFWPLWSAVILVLLIAIALIGPFKGLAGLS